MSDPKTWKKKNEDLRSRQWFGRMDRDGFAYRSWVKGKGVPDGKVSLALRLTFRAADRTLTDGEIQTAMDAIVRALVAEHDAVQR